MLIRQSELMKEYQHNGDLCARMQNDRFAMLVPSDHKIEEHIISCINLMQEEFKSSLFRLHIFAGIYEIDDTDEPVSIMCDKANIASETIKNSYQKYVAYYNNDLLERSIEERRIIGEFEKAIDNNEFVMFLQPQVDCKGMAYGAEALVRWQHPERGLLSPAVFIDVLEKQDLYISSTDICGRRQLRSLESGREKAMTGITYQLISLPRIFILLMYMRHLQGL